MMEHPIPPHGPTDERKLIYQEYRTAKRKPAGRAATSGDWMKIARCDDEARREATHRAGTNTPQGTTYREEFTKIDHRERLIDRDEQGREFPSPEDRTFCIKVLEKLRCSDLRSAPPLNQGLARQPLRHRARQGQSPEARLDLADVANTAPRVEQEAKRTEPVTNPMVTKPAQPDTKPVCSSIPPMPRLQSLQPASVSLRTSWRWPALGLASTRRMLPSWWRIVACGTKCARPKAAARKAEKPQGCGG